jgi:GT2 family glycosyltransferase/glycosyltransferase involved in cell wall biosynthesis
MFPRDHEILYVRKTRHYQFHIELRMNFNQYVIRSPGYVPPMPTVRSFNIVDWLPLTEPPDPVALRGPVDIIVPVYRGLAQTRRCLESVLADSERPDGAVIVIDDKSPEPAVSAWLDELEAAGLITLHRNAENQGFVASVNHGMALAAGRDVVLLNSDTVVSSGWLNRLVSHAVRNPRIATISPFSNNATICSWPDGRGGPPPEGFSQDELDRAARIANPGRAVGVPTSVGFCMFIARAAIDDVGDFDVATFGHGYGEENDFCLRASARGWRHLLACDVFVHHEGSVSFGAAMATRAAAAMDTLKSRYPDYLALLASHARADPAGPARFALTATLLAQTGRPVILMVSHALGGGVRRHVDDLVRRLAGRSEVLLLTPSAHGVTLTAPGLANHPAVALAAEQMSDLLRWLKAAGVSRVHVHHLAQIRMNIQELIRRLDVPFDVTIHDYYVICPQTTLLQQPEGVYCQEPGPAECNACIAVRPAWGAREIVSWRHRLNWLCLDAERVICPSQDVFDRLARHGLAGQALVAPHETWEEGPWPIQLHPRGPAPARLRVVILGTLADHKGAKTVAALCQSTPGLDIHVVGEVEENFPAEARKSIHIGGAYAEAALPGLIRRASPHVLWFPAPWPETYSYTLSAAIDSGLPIVATNIGAFPERLRGRPLSWLVPPLASLADWRAVFEEVRSAVAAQPDFEVRPRRTSTADFYGDEYLAPARRPPQRGFRRNDAGNPDPEWVGAPGKPRSRPRIAVLAERLGGGTISPCAFIRLLLPLDHPAIGGDCDIVIADAKSILHEPADLIVTQRHAAPDLATARALLDRANAIGATLVYDIDDDLLNIPATHPEAAMLQSKAAPVLHLLRHAHAVWVSTAELAARLATTRAAPLVVPNGLDERIWDAVPRPAPSASDPVRILLMGTATHDADYALVEPALARLKADFGNRVSIDVLGFTTRRRLANGITRLAMPEHAALSYPGFVNLFTRSGQWDIGLAPLLDTRFNAAKSPIKALDYAALGLAILASEGPVYRGSVADGPGGELVTNDEAAWFIALRELVANPGRRLRMGAAALAAFRLQGTLASQAETRRRALLNALPRTSADSSTPVWTGS